MSDLKFYDRGFVVFQADGTVVAQAGIVQNVAHQGGPNSGDYHITLSQPMVVTETSVNVTSHELFACAFGVILLSPTLMQILCEDTGANPADAELEVRIASLNPTT